MMPAQAVPDLDDRAAAENFPVGSWLLPRRTRGVVHAFYRFARGADDIADSPHLPAERKLRLLAHLDAVLTGVPADPGLPAARAAGAFHAAAGAAGVSLIHARELLVAFRADAANEGIPDRAALMRYCRFSANPVGRFLLELHGEGQEAQAPADALCTALQIVNHLQDCKADCRDLSRVYVPCDWLAQEGLGPTALVARQSSAALRRVLDRVLDEVDTLNAAAAMLPSRLRDGRLRMEAAVIVELCRRLAAELRRRDPLAERVALAPGAKLGALLSGLLRAWGAR